MGIIAGSSLHQQETGLQVNDAVHLGQIFIVPALCVSILQIYEMLLLFCILLLMQLIVITPDSEIKDEAGLVNGLFANGLQRLHIRKPQFTTADYRNYIASLDPKYHTHIVLHGGFELMNEFVLGGIHLNSMLRHYREALADDLHPSQISTSFHSWQEIRDNEFEYGYVFISPVFDSISKKGYKAEIAINGATEIKREFAVSNKYCPALIGLGGVGKEQIDLLRQNGFDGAALLGAIWLSADPVTEFTEIIKITRSL